MQPTTGTADGDNNSGHPDTEEPAAETFMINTCENKAAAKDQPTVQMMPQMRERPEQADGDEHLSYASGDANVAGEDDEDNFDEFGRKVGSGVNQDDEADSNEEDDAANRREFDLTS